MDRIQLRLGPAHTAALRSAFPNASLASGAKRCRLADGTVIGSEQKALKRSVSPFSMYLSQSFANGDIGVTTGLFSGKLMGNWLWERSDPMPYSIN